MSAPKAASLKAPSRSARSPAGAARGKPEPGIPRAPEPEAAARDEQLDTEVARRTEELASANAALRDSEQRLRLILESATDYAILTIDLDGRVTSWNPGAERILGYPAGEILQQSAAVLFTPDDRADNIPRIEMDQAAGEGRACCERWHMRADGSRFWGGGTVMPLRDGAAQPHGFLKILRDHTGRHREQERRMLLLHELDHRVKNILATVQSVAGQTLRNASSPAAFQETFEARLGALARAHDLLSRGGWKGAGLQAVVERTLEAYAPKGANRIRMEGPAVLLTPNVAVTLNLALHELATNAAKYGALSGPRGWIEILWTLEAQPDDAATVLVLSWREREGPVVRPPRRRGFGSRLLEQALPYESGGVVELEFAPAGVECRVRLPLGLRQETP
jgi:PAS domain S-box-containing protein